MENDNMNGQGGWHIVVYGDGNQVAQSITNTYNGSVYNGKSKNSDGDSQPERTATREMMSRAAKITLDGGYWKSQRSWSVVFIVYGIWGYKGRVSDFLDEVPGWPDNLVQRMTCNRDAVEKLKNMYNFTKDITAWRANGVPEQYCILGEQLDSELTAMTLQDRE